MNRLSAALVGACLVCLAPTAGAQTWTIDHNASIFAVVTHKEGLAAGLAHEHFIVAAEYEATLRESAGRPESFTIEFATADLLVDDPSQASAWQGPLLELELIGEAFAELSEKDRGKIRKSMLSKKQLDAEAFPEIRATLSEIRPGETGGYVGRLSLTVKGKSASRDIEFDWPAASASSVSDQSGAASRRVEVTTTFDFTDFGIEPYSAMLGSIRVADTFHVLAVLVATLE